MKMGSTKRLVPLSLLFFICLCIPLWLLLSYCFVLVHPLSVCLSVSRCCLPACQSVYLPTCLFSSTHLHSAALCLFSRFSLSLFRFSFVRLHACVCLFGHELSVLPIDGCVGRHNLCAGGGRMSSPAICLRRLHRGHTILPL